MMDLNVKRNISILIKNQENYKITVLSLVNIELENNFIPSFNVEQQFRVLHDKPEKNSLSITFKGLYVSSEPILLLEKNAFSQIQSDYDIDFSKSLSISGKFFISEYAVESGIDDLLYFNVTMISSGEIKYNNYIEEKKDENRT